MSKWIRNDWSTRQVNIYQFEHKETHCRTGESRTVRTTVSPSGKVIKQSMKSKRHKKK